MDSHAIDKLISRAQASDQEAWTTLFEACYPQVVAAIQLDAGMRRMYDEVDFVNEAFHRLAVDPGRLDFATIDDLIAHLVADARSLVAIARQEIR